MIKLISFGLIFSEKLSINLVCLKTELKSVLCFKRQSYSLHPFGSNIAIGTPPSARAGCGFTAIGSRLFVFSGQTNLPDKTVFGDHDYVYPSLPH